MTDTHPSHEEHLRREALAWLTRVVLHEATAADMKALREWRDTSPAHAAALARAGHLWRGVEAASAALVREGAVALPVDRSPKHGPSRRVLLGAGMAVAAASTGVAVVRPPFHLWPSLAELGADYRTTTGEQRHINLVDAISIEMNTQTSIATRAAVGMQAIDLISGEVAVTVGPDAQQQFVASAGPGKVATQFATFNLRRDGAAFKLMCIQGKVTLECESRFIELGPASQVAYDENGLSAVSAAEPEAVAWRDGMLVFRDTPLSRVIDEVNRYRSGRIILIDRSLATRSVNARFEISRLDTVLSQIRHVFKAPIKSLPGGIVLVG